MLWSLSALLSQHVVTLSIIEMFGLTSQRVGRPTDDWLFYIMPLRSVVMGGQSPGILLLFALAYSLIVAWALAALAFRRAANANITEWIAAAVCIVPPRPPPDPSQIAEVFEPEASQPRAATQRSVAGPGVSHRAASQWSAAAQGSIVGLGLT
jgi:hypothetical protein